MKNQINLDSDGSTSVFWYEKYCSQTKNINNGMDIQTNSGNMIMKKKCKILKLGEGYFHGKFLTNIIGLSDMRKISCVTNDSGKETAFQLHLQN